MNDNKKTLIVIGFIAVFIIFSGLKDSFTSVGDNNKVQDILLPVTAITGSIDANEKATVYKSTESLRDTAEAFISSQKPSQMTDLSDEEIITLYYSDEIVVIYEGESDLVYVQISSRAYVYRNGYRHVFRPARTYMFVNAMSDYNRGHYSRDQRTFGGNGYKDASGSSVTSVRTVDSSGMSYASSKSWGALKGGSVRGGSSSTRSSIGGGTSYGK